jgi:hypothetical protein
MPHYKAYRGKILVDVVVYGKTAEDARANCGSAMNIGPFDLNPDGLGDFAQGQGWRPYGEFTRLYEWDVTDDSEIIEWTEP